MGGGLGEGAPRRWDHLGVGATHPLLPLCADTPPSPIPVFLGVRSPGPNWEEMGSRTAAESQALMGKSAAGGPREPRDSPSARAPGSPGAVAKSERGLGKPRSPRPARRPLTSPGERPAPRGPRAPSHGSGRPEPGPRSAGRPGPAAAPARRVLAPPPAPQAQAWEAGGASRVRGGSAPGRCRRGRVVGQEPRPRPREHVVYSSGRSFPG